MIFPRPEPQRRERSISREDRERFASSATDATKWLIVYHPERLRTWINRHQDGELLVRVCREEIVAKHGPDWRQKLCPEKAKEDN